MIEFSRIINETIKNGTCIVLVTVVGVQGSAPQKIGAKMLVSSDGKILWGTVGGGTIEELAKNQAKIQIQQRKPLLKEYELTEEGVNATGMICGGNMTLFFDLLGTSTNVYIFGAGHISQQIVPLLTKLGFSCRVIDDRYDYLRESFPNAESSQLITGKLPQIIDTIEFIPRSYVIIMTYSHELDEKILKHLLTNKIEEAKELAYMGMIGSKRKVKEIFDRLISDGIDSDILDTIHAPIGIQIGSQTPEEISISIAAELIKIRNEME